VRDHDAGEGGVVEQRFEPRDAGEVEVVGGLVEEQNVGWVTMASAMARRLRQPPESVAASASREGKPVRPEVSWSRPSRSDSAMAARVRAAVRTSRTVRPGAKADSCLT
jgi:hypothetical protein